MDYRIEYKEGSKDIKLVNIKALLNPKVLLDKLNKKKENTTTTMLCFYSFYLWKIIGTEGKRKQAVANQAQSPCHIDTCLVGTSLLLLLLFIITKATVKSL